MRVRLVLTNLTMTEASDIISTANSFNGMMFDQAYRQGDLTIDVGFPEIQSYTYFIQSIIIEFPETRIRSTKSVTGATA